MRTDNHCSNCCLLYGLQTCSIRTWAATRKPSVRTDNHCSDCCLLYELQTCSIRTWAATRKPSVRTDNHCSNCCLLYGLLTCSLTWAATRKPSVMLVVSAPSCMSDTKRPESVKKVRLSCQRAGVKCTQIVMINSFLIFVSFSCTGCKEGGGNNLVSGYKWQVFHGNYWPDH